MPIHRIAFLSISIWLLGCSSNPQQSNEPGTIDPRTEGAFTFHQIDGDSYPGDPVPEGAVMMYHWPILKSCSIESTEQRREMFKALDDGIAEAGRSSSDLMPDCFNPRHAIRVDHEGVQTDWLICFQCRNYEIREDGRVVGGGALSNTPRKLFNEILDGCAPSP